MRNLAAAGLVAGGLLFCSGAMGAGLTLQPGATMTMTGSPTMQLVGDFQNAGSFVSGTSTVVMNGDISATIVTNGDSFYNFTVCKTSVSDSTDNVTILTNDLTVTNTTTIADGELIQSTTDFILNGFTVDSPGKYSNISTGDLYLSGDVTNNGSIFFDGGGVGEGHPDDILIRSTIGAVQHNWQGTGAFSFTDVDVQDQTAIGGTPPMICPLNSTDTGNNINWFCGTLQNVSVIPASLIAGATSTNTTSFELANILPADGKIVITFPAGFDVSGVTTASSLADIDGTFTVSVSGQVVTITRNGDGSPIAGGTFIDDLLIPGVINPGVSGLTGNFNVETRSSLNAEIDSGVAAGVPIAPGALTSVTLSPSTLAAGNPADHTFDFTTANTLPSDGKIYIEYPSGFDLTTITGVSSTTLDGTLSFTVSGQTLIITRTPGTNEVAGAQQLVVAGITNPVVAGLTSPINLYTADSAGTPIDAGTAAGLNISAGNLTNVFVTPASLIAGATTPNTIGFKTAGILPADGKIKITYPANFDVSGAAAASSATDIDGTFSVAVMGQMVIVTRSGGTAIPAGSTIDDLIITGIVNPAVTGLTGNFDVNTLTAADVTIDSGVAPGVPISTGALTALSITPTSTIAGASGDHTVDFTTANTIPSDGHIKIEYPAGFDLTTITSITSGTIDGTLSFTLIGQTLCVDRSGGTAQLAGVEQIVVHGITNPLTAGTTPPIDVYTTDNALTPIDAGTAPGITITAGGTLTNASVIPTSLLAGTTSNNTVGFQLASALPLDGKIKITYPANFDLTGVSGASSASDIDGTLSVAVMGNMVVVTRSGGTAITGGTFINDLVIAGVKNPPISGLTGDFYIDTLTSADATIDSGTASGVPIAAGALSGVSVSPSSTFVSVPSSYTVNFTTSNTIPIDGQIKLEFPVGYDLSTITGVTSATIDGTLNVVVVGQTLCVERSAGTAQTPGAETLVIANLTNPATAGTTAPIDVYTASSTGVPIDSGTAAGLTFTAPAFTFSSASSSNLVVGVSNQAIASFTITEDSTPVITAVNDIRIIIPPGLSSTWDTTVTTVTLSGSAAGKVSPTVSYESGNTVLVLNVTSDFSINDDLTVSGMKIDVSALATIGAVGNLQLDYDDAGAAANLTDDKTLTITAGSDFDANYSMAAFNGCLYVGSGTDTGTGGTAKIFKTCDGVTYSQVNVNGFGDPNNIAVTKLVAWNGRLIATTHNTVTGTELWMTTDGTTWTQINVDGFGTPNNVLAESAVVFGQIQPENSGGLFFGTSNAVDGAQVFVDPSQSSVSKVGNKKQVVVGDIVTYQVMVHNNDANDLQSARIIDALPKGFSYIPGSAYVDGAPIADPAGETVKTFDITSVSVGQTKSLMYQLIVTPGVEAGTRYTNTATVAGTILGNPVTYPTAHWEVLVVEDPLFDEVTVIGKVFHDANGNGVQDLGEKGIAKARLVTEEGIIITTDLEGRYHLMGVKPKRHVIKIMSRSLPEGAVMTTPAENLFNATAGSIVKANFGVAMAEDVVVRGVETSPVRKGFEELLRNRFVEDMFMVSLTEGEIGANSVGGNKHIPSANSAEYANSFSHDGRVAYFVDADLVHDFRFVSSLDTDRENKKLSTNFDERYYYRTYGDESEADYTWTETQGKLYMRLQRHKSYALWGNYLTDLDESEVLQYNRMLYGLKVRYQTDDLTKFKEPYHKTIAFSAQAKQIPSHDRFRATGGSLYYLKNRNVIEGSDRVKILVQNEVTGLPESPIELTHDEYEIDYREGRIILKYPVQSFVPNQSVVHDDLRLGNPVYLVVDYDYESDDFIDKGVAGIDVMHRFNEHIGVGVTQVREGQSGNNYELRGLRGEFKLDPNNVIRAEYGISQSEGIQSYVSDNGGLSFARISQGDQSRGQAFVLSADNKISDKLISKMYYKNIDQGFSNTSAIEAQGSERYGAAIQYTPSQNVALSASHDVLEVKNEQTLTANSFPGSQRKATSSVQVDTLINDRAEVSAEIRHENLSDSLNDQVEETGTYLAAQTRYRISDNVKVLGRQQFTLAGEENLQTSLGFEAKIDELTDAELVHTFGEKGNGLQGLLSRKINDDETIYISAGAGGGESNSLEIGEKGLLNRSYTFGKQKRIDEKTTVAQETSIGKQFEDRAKQYQSDMLSKITRINHQFSKNLSASLSYELADLEQNKGDIQRNAFSLGVTYNDQKRIKNAFKMDYRSDGVGANQITQTLIEERLEYKWSKDFTALFDTSLALTTSKELGTALAEFNELSLGVAYRPVDQDRLNGLLRYTYLQDQPLNFNTGFVSDIPNTANNSSYHVVAADLVYDINPRLQLAEKFGLRMNLEKVDPEPLRKSTTWLVVNRLNYKLTDVWGLGGEYRMLGNDQSQTLKNGFLFEVFYDWKDVARLSVGYNMTDFSDDLTDLDYDVQKVYFRVSGFLGTDYKTRAEKSNSILDNASSNSNSKPVNTKLDTLFSQASSIAGQKS